MKLLLLLLSYSHQLQGSNDLAFNCTLPSKETLETQSKHKIRIRKTFHLIKESVQDFHSNFKVYSI